MVLFPRSHLLQEWVHEALACGMFVFFGLAVVAVNGGPNGYLTDTPQIIMIALTLGISYGALINFFPTAHIMPINTLAVALDEVICAMYGKIPWEWPLRFLGTWLIQIVTGFLGALSVWILIDREDTDLGTPKDGPGIDDWRLALTIFFMSTTTVFVYMWSLLQVGPMYSAWNKNEYGDELAAGNLIRTITNGGILIVLNFVTITISGGAVNPVRFLSGAVVANAYGSDWPYYIFLPFAGALAGWILYLALSALQSWSVFRKAQDSMEKTAKRSKKRIAPGDT